MHNAFRDALVVEMGDLFPQDKILDQGRPTGTGLERVLIVGDGRPMIGGEGLLRVSGGLVGLGPGGNVSGFLGGGGFGVLLFRHGMGGRWRLVLAMGGK